MRGSPFNQDLVTNPTCGAQEATREDDCPEFHTAAGLQSGPLKGPSPLPALVSSRVGAAFTSHHLQPGPPLEQRRACGLSGLWIPPETGQGAGL